MSRIVAVAAVFACGLAAIAVVAIAHRGGKSKTVATVSGHRITRDDLGLAVEHFHEEADREGRPFPDKGTKAYAVVERIALRLLIDRAAIEAAATRLGVHVTDDQVDARLAAGTAGEGEEGPDIRIRAEAAFRRGTTRAQLITEAVYRRLTAGIHVPPATVRAYFNRHRAIYGSTPFTRAAPAIRSQLVSARKNAVFARWLAEVRRSEPRAEG